MIAPLPLLLLLLGALAIAALARALGSTTGPALFAGAAYALHGGSVARAGSPGEALAVALLPAMLWLADRALLASAARGFPDAAGLALALLALLYAGRPREAVDAALAVAAYALCKRPRRRQGLTMVVGALLLPLLMLRLSDATPGEPAARSRDALALGLFPYFRPGLLHPPAELFVGIVVLALALVALVSLAPRRTAAPAMVAALSLVMAARPLAADGVGAPPFLGWGAGLALLAGLGLSLCTTGLLSFATVARRNVLGTVMALLGGACFHAVGLYLRGGERPGEAPGAALGIVLAAAMFVAAVAPLLPILKGGWEERRRALAALVAVVGVVELLAVALRS